MLYSFDINATFFSNVNSIGHTITTLDQVIEAIVDFPGNELFTIGFLVREDFGQSGANSFFHRRCQYRGVEVILFISIP